jgi:NlpC/P60 family putative phage cell wall peptidase
VAAARGWIGTPYRHQGRLKGVGCDCLGLIIGVWRQIASEEVVPLPPYTPDWAEAHGRETFAEGARRYLEEIDPAEAREGDLVLFRWRAHLPAKHAGILTAPNMMVHAQEGCAVAEVPLNNWWRRRMAYVFRFPSRPDPPPREDAASEGYPSPNPSPPNSGVPEFGIQDGRSRKHPTSGGGGEFAHTGLA